jgi:threonine/homoserine/homoserine lactone efflux protein
VWGVIIGLGVALALTPICPLAVIVLLSVQRGVRKAWAFFCGEFLILSVICAAAVVLQFGTSQESASRASSIVTLVAGVVLLCLGAYLTAQSRRSGEAKEPSWLAKADQMEPWPAFLLGVFLPTYVFAIAAGAHIVGTHPGTATAIAAMLVFLVVGTSTVYTPIVLAQVVPERSGPVRARLRDWLVKNWHEIGAVLLLVVGALLIAKGVIALD